MKSAREKFQSDANSQISDIFDHLVHSAFDFLVKAIEQIESERKHSVVNFATAIELFLKARLFKEHWSLIADNPDTADKIGFLAGTVKTVTPDKAIGRLDKICGDPVPSQAVAEFKKLAAHRNRVIHFFHDVESPKSSRKALENTAIEQFRGWHYLEQLLRSWGEHLADYDQDIERVAWKMRRHASFLDARFQALKKDLVQAAAEGTTIAECDRCGHKAAKVRPLSDIVSHLNCAVCGITTTIISFSCLDEDCEATIELSSHMPEKRSCDECQRHYDSAEVCDALGGGSRYEDFAASINCAACTTLGSGVDHDDIVVCSECFTAEENAPQCDWCSDRQIGGGDLRSSGWKGCEFCDGRSGWDRD